MNGGQGWWDQGLAGYNDLVWLNVFTQRWMDRWIDGLESE